MEHNCTTSLIRIDYVCYDDVVTGVSTFIIFIFLRTFAFSFRNLPCPSLLAENFPNNFDYYELLVKFR